MIKLGKLEKVGIRKIWEHEATGFTPWLAKYENLSLLGEELGIEFDSDSIEVGEKIGDFIVDIYAKDINEKKIIIENQLERTDHDHLGKCITYAAGINADTIIWIAKEARDEHRQAVEWLNSNSNDGLNFFFIQIEAWQIEDSKPAPKFNIIESPNEWARNVKSGTSGSSGERKISDTNLTRQKFWEDLRDYGEENSKKVKGWQKAGPYQWYTVRFGTTKGHISLVANTRPKEVRVEFYIDSGDKNENKSLYQRILKDKERIESELGNLNWQELVEKRASIISQNCEKDFEDEVDREVAINWLVETTDKFITVFSKYTNKNS